MYIVTATHYVKGITLCIKMVPTHWVPVQAKTTLDTTSL